MLRAADVVGRGGWNDVVECARAPRSSLAPARRAASSPRCCACCCRSAPSRGGRLARCCGAQSLEPPAGADRCAIPAIVARRRRGRAARPVADRARLRQRGDAGGRVLRGRRRAADVVPPLPVVVAPGARRARDRGPRRLGGGAARLPGRGVSPRPQRAVRRARRIGGVHHRLGGRLPPRRRRADAGYRAPAPAASCCWPNRKCRSSTTRTRRPDARRCWSAPRSCSARASAASVCGRGRTRAASISIARPIRRSSRPSRASSRRDVSRSAASLAESDAEKANPWLLLQRTFEDGAVPVDRRRDVAAVRAARVARGHHVDRRRGEPAARPALRRRAARQRAAGRAGHGGAGVRARVPGRAGLPVLPDRGAGRAHH